jgi:hypothetical protein
MNCAADGCSVALAAFAAEKHVMHAEPERDVDDRWQQDQPEKVTRPGRQHELYKNSRQAEGEDRLIQCPVTAPEATLHRKEQSRQHRERGGDDQNSRTNVHRVSR